MLNIKFRISYTPEAARGSWLTVLLGVQSMDWGGGGGGGGGAWEPAQAPSELPITLHTAGLVYVMCNTLQATANKNKDL